MKVKNNYNILNSDFTSEPEVIGNKKQDPRYEEQKFMVRRSQPNKLKQLPLLNKQNSNEISDSVSAKSKRPPPKDYLKEMKSKREQDEGSNSNRRNLHLFDGRDLDRVLKNRNLSEAEKYNLVRIKTD